MSTTTRGQARQRASATPAANARRAQQQGRGTNEQEIENRIQELSDDELGGYTPEGRSEDDDGSVQESGSQRASDNLPSNETLPQAATSLELLMARIQELEEQARGRDTVMALATQVLETQASSRRRRSDSSDEDRPRKRYTISPKSLRTYEGKNPREHEEWFQDLRDTIKTSAPYFSSEAMQIRFALLSMDQEPKASWRDYIGDKPETEWTLDGFQEFLLNRIEDPVNRHLTVSRAWHDLRQEGDQKTSDFANKLAGMEKQMDALPEWLRRDVLLHKLRPELNRRILSAGQEIPKTRDALVALATRLEPQWVAGASTSSWAQRRSQGQARGSATTTSVVKKHEASTPRPGKESKRESSSVTETTSTSTSAPFSGTCNYCQKAGHRVAQCWKRQREEAAKTSVGAVSKPKKDKKSGSDPEPKN